MRRGVCFFVAMVVFCAPALAYDWNTNSGDGSAANPYQISTTEHLMSIGSDPGLLDKHFILTNDIVFDPNNNPAHVFTAALIAPDADPDKDFAGTPFSGHFDGQGFTVYNFRIQTTEAYFLGLFGCISGSDACVTKLTMVNPTVTTVSNSYDIGALAGELIDGTISHCTVTGPVITGRTCVGGLVGFSDGFLEYCQSRFADISGAYDIGGLAGLQNGSSITACSSTGTVTGTGSRIGGLVGNTRWLDATIRDSYSSCTVIGDNRTGGLVGELNGAYLYDCYASGDVTASEIADFIGGLVGETQSGSVIKDCYASGAVWTLGQTGDHSPVSAGGLVGHNSGGSLIERCYATGNVESPGKSDVGGLVGSHVGSASMIRSCYATGDVAITGSEGGWAGGLVAENFGIISDCYARGNVSCNIWCGGCIAVSDGCDKISRCYSTGTVTGGFGFIDQNLNCSEELTDCFWDVNTSGIPDGDNPKKGVGLPTEQMQESDTFLSSGWDFVGESVNGDNEIWRMCVDGEDYPRLSWEFSPNGDFACGDGVDINDLQALADAWLTAADISPTTFNYACDANGDERIDLGDFAVLGENW